MKPTITLIIFVFSVVFCKAQEKMLRGYDFSKGNYALYLIKSKYGGENRTPPIGSMYVDTIVSYYTRNVDILKQIQKELVIYTKNSFLQCGYQHDFYLIKDSKMNLVLPVNLECGYFLTEKGQQDFVSATLKKYKKHLKPVTFLQQYCQTREKGKLFWDSISKDESFLSFANQRPPWLDFEGEANVEWNFLDSVDYDDWNKAIDKYMKAHFPNQAFAFTDNGPNYISCNKDLYDSLSIVQQCKWRDYSYYGYFIELFLVPKKQPK
jgi:hypothetical protein